MEADRFFIGRQKEILELKRIYQSPKPEFLVVYGRRRVGKTFLVREFFNYQFDFQASGLANATTAQQLFNFHLSLNRQSALHFERPPENWLIAFQRLMDHLESLPIGKKKVVFFDEMPWFDTKGSDFVLGLEHFWNGWASARKDILLVACGSAASWMTNVLINHTGGLHNRVTQKIKIEPFNLKEVEEMLEQKQCVYNRYQIVQLYMALGGIPFYLDAIKPELSVAQNIQALFFEKTGILKNEFFNLYRSIFKKHEIYEKVVAALATKRYGMLRSEIANTADISSGGTLTKVLIDLEEGGFINSYPALEGKQKNTLYRLADYYTAFYFHFIHESPYKGKNAWLNLIDNPAHRAWEGFTFEQVCLDHSTQIKKALGIAAVLSREVAWRGNYEGKSAQVDMVIDRRDQVINLCEAKFSLHTFTITEAYAEQLREKISTFKSATKTKKAVHLTLLTTYGLAQNKHSGGLVQSHVTMNDLFADE
ncbi:MAG TPA: ATP-binding protein [Saprospiraceae bacterium]|nr:ATP-binding protein [Saprospiraceae bacterium]HMQ84734.1 ATP-binding protein [Saprospiraceae bacterium]